MISQLSEQGLLPDAKMQDFYTTFMAGIFRCQCVLARPSAHGEANMVCFDYFAEQGAFVRNDDGTYQVDYVEKSKKP